jgi:DAK2 domain fusion protein YloV
VPDPSIQRFRRVVEVALRHLESRREEINDLNVFPVADGDTGDNMARTMEAVRQALDRLERDAGEDAPREQIVKTVAEAALLGARGNSGVITSQIVRGAAEVLATPTGRLVDPALIVESLQGAARAARESVAQPAEGTMLTVIDEMAAAAAERLAGHRVLGGEISDDEQNALLAEMLAVVLEVGDEAVRRTPEQLQVLADAETVDAGAYALVVLVRGMIAGLLGDDKGLPPLPHYPAARIDAAGHADSRYDHCLNVVVRRSHSDLVPELPDGVPDLGDSIEVVGDAAMLRVHIHTDTPERVVELLSPLGEVHVDSSDYMPDQIAARRARAQAASSGTLLVAVSDGAGFEQLFAELGVSVVPGGPKLNPSAEEILSVIEDGAGSEAVVFPNSPNVVLAAEEAARSSDRRVLVAPCHSPQAAAELLVALDHDRSAEEIVEEVGELIGDVRTAAVAEAAREDGEGRFSIGDGIGLIGEEVVSWGTPEEALAGAIETIAGDDAEVLTVFCGGTAPLARSEVEALLPKGLEASVLDGGQSTHWWLLSAQ